MTFFRTFCLLWIVLTAPFWDGPRADAETSEGLVIAPFRRQTTEEGRLVYDINAVRAYVQPTTRQMRLETIRRASFYDVNRTIHLSAKSGTWDPNNTRLRLEGDVQVVLAEVRVPPSIAPAATSFWRTPISTTRT